MRFLLLLLVARAAFISADPTGEKREIEEFEPPPTPEIPDVDIFGSGVITDCGWASALLPSCPDDLGCGDQPPCPEGQICSYQGKEFQCRDEDICKGKLDICFVIDTSGSIGSTNFNTLINFIKDLIGASDVGEDAVKTSAVRFSNAGREEVLWDLGDTEATVEADADLALDALNDAYNGGRTCIWCGLRLCRNDVFGPADNRNGDNRDDAQDVVILLTDGRNNEPSNDQAQGNQNVLDEAQNLKDDGALIEVVAIGNSINTPQLEQVSSRGSIFNVEGFNDLQGIIDDLLEAACAP